MFYSAFVCLFVCLFVCVSVCLLTTLRKSCFMTILPKNVSLGKEDATT